MRLGSQAPAGSIELKFALHDQVNMNKEEPTPNHILQAKWTTFVQCQAKIHNTFHANMPSDVSDAEDSDDIGADFEDADDISPQDYDRLIRSLTLSNHDDEDLETSSIDDEVGTTDEEGSSLESDAEYGDEHLERTYPLIPPEDAKAAPPEIKALNRHDSTLLPKAPRVLQVPTKEAKPRRRRRIRRKKARSETVPRGYYEFNSRSQVVGIAYLEIVNATDLPPMSNMTRTGFDMDPFVVTSFGRKTFRSAWRRHTLNPVFNESLMFPVLNHERGFSINFTVMDKDKFTLHDHVATADFPIQSILDTAPLPDAHTLLYDIESLGMQPCDAPSAASQLLSTSLEPDTEYHTSDSSPARASESSYLAGNPTESTLKLPQSNGLPQSSSTVSLTALNNQARANRPRRSSKKSTPMDANMVDYVIPLTLMKSKYEGKHKPELRIRARFLPYAALRQQFWRGLIRVYDADQSNSMNIFEIMDMLDQMGATLSERTVKSYFSRFGKRFNVDELTIDELVICLEEQILKDTIAHNHPGMNLNQQQPPASSHDSRPGSQTLPVIDETLTDEEYIIDVDGMPTPVDKALPIIVSTPTADNTPPEGPSELYDSDILDEIYDKDEEEEDSNIEERLIRVVACPFCGQPRLNNKAEIDIVTHLATCASQDWSRVNLLAMNKFVSSNQARKRWYTKMVFKVTYGNYKVGANSANILVQDRATGFIQEEKMNAYVRLGIRLLYKGLRSSRMESKRIRGILRKASFKQGRKYDDPSSARAIEPFIKFHNLDLSEVLLPLDRFKNFNAFFYRKLKPGTRVCEAADEPRIAVSPADCRSTYFPTIAKAMEIWIKGKGFSIERLFGDAYPEHVSKFVSGSLAVFRLAPQDYHRFHIPVSGVMGEPKTIEGEYYTVNPMAIRSALDVFGENIRVLVPIQSEEFGLVMVVCVGAMMVGSTVITRKAGERVERMEELGYFQFGGSTLIVLFEPNKIKFDSDLVSNSNEALETLVKVGMSIGHTNAVPQFVRHDASGESRSASAGSVSLSPASAINAEE